MNDLRLAFRLLPKSPGFTAVAVLTLALGLGANTAVFSVINRVLPLLLPFEDSDRLVWVRSPDPRNHVRDNSAAGPGYLAWRLARWRLGIGLARVLALIQGKVIWGSATVPTADSGTAKSRQRERDLSFARGGTESRNA
jgi:hypothetical protein